MTRAQIVEGHDAFMEQMKANMLTADEVRALISGAEATGAMAPGTAAHNNANISASQGINASIVEFGKAQAATHGTRYSQPNRSNLWTWADCSSFVWGSFRDHQPPVSQGDDVEQPATAAQLHSDDDKCRTGASPVQEVFTTNSSSPTDRSRSSRRSSARWPRATSSFASKGSSLGTPFRPRRVRLLQQPGCPDRWRSATPLVREDRSVSGA